MIGRAAWGTAVERPPEYIIVAEKARFVFYVYLFQQSIDQPVKVANPACGELNRKNDCLPYSRSLLRIWSRETGADIRCHVSPLIFHTTQAESEVCSWALSYRFRR